MYETWSSGCLVLGLALLLALFVATGITYAGFHHDIHYYGCTNVTNSQYLKVVEVPRNSKISSAVALENGCGYKITYDFFTSQSIPFLDGEFVGWCPRGTLIATIVEAFISLGLFLVWAIGYSQHKRRRI